MAGEEKENIWQDEDELRRMMIEAEENERSEEHTSELQSW